ncbi:MAG: radical SAM protein [Armatimonadaceae bacterium]
MWSEETTGLCPTCLRTVPATLREEGNQIWIQQFCPRHGENRALLASDAAEYRRLRQYVPPRVSSAVTGACCCGPEDDCGETAGPPTCVLLLEITQACNLRCPTCYADSGANGPATDHDFITLVEARRRLEAFFLQQTTLDVLMLSGGEPTIHPQFRELLEMALAYPINRILVNTNGLRLNQSTELVELLSAHRKRVELYFSYASFRPEVHQRLYGVDLTRQKRQALETAQAAGIFTTLVPTVEQGVNNDEIADLYRFALSLDNINGITYQPVMNNGRYKHTYRPEDRLTLTGVLHRLEEQTGGELRSTDFVGLPCSHPDCCALTYGFLNEQRNTLTPLTRHLDIARYLDLVSDRISFSGIVGAAAKRVWSDMVHLRSGETLRDLGVLFTRAGFREIVPLLGDPEKVGRRVFRVVVKPFMDAHTYDHKRVQECCTKILNEQGEAVSFCEFNVFHRGRPRPKTAGLSLNMAK